MHTWHHLVRIALLGTEKMSLPESVLPEAVRQRLSAADPSDREAWFYKAAALTYVYEKAGTLPVKTPVPDLQPAPNEQQPVCPEAVQRFLTRMLEHKNKRPDILGFCFETIAAKGWVLAPEQLVPILNLCLQPPFKQLQALMPAIAGERGLWMLQFNPAWQFLTPKDPEILWTEGSNADRRQFLQELRNRDPELAFELVRQTWAEENNSRERKELLKVLQSCPQPGESDFVQAILEELLKNKDQSKAILAEIKNLAVDILLMDADSALVQDILTQLRSYTVVQKSLPGTHTGAILPIPEKQDAFFSPAIMCEQLGLEPASPLAGIPEPAYWFSELVRRVHPILWERALNRPWPEILALFAGAEEKFEQSKLPLLEHIAQALGRSQYLPGIRAYIQAYPLDASNYFMLNALSDTEFERFILEKMPDQLPDYLWDALRRKGWTWSLPLSRHVIKCLTSNYSSGHHHQDFAKMLNFGMHFNLGILPELQQAVFVETKDWQQQNFRNQYLMPLLHLLESRKTITQF